MGWSAGASWRRAGLLVLLVFLSLYGCKAPPVSTAPPSGTVLSISASPTRIRARNGASAITVTALDGQGYSVPDGTDISLLTTLGRVTESIKTTGGVAQGTLRSDGREGTATVTAYAGSAAGVSTTVTIGDVAGSMGITAYPAKLGSAGGASRITATVFDSQSNRLAGAHVVFATTAGSLESGGRVLTTDRSGEASDTLHTTDAATVTATSGSLTASVVVSLESAVPARSLTLTADPESIPQGQTSTTLTAAVTDVDDLPIPGISVVFKTTAGSLSQPGAVVTDGSGEARNVLTTDQEAVITATAGGGLSASLTVIKEGVPTTLSLTAAPSVLPPGGNPAPAAPVQLKAIVWDGLGQRVPGAPVWFEVEGSGTLTTTTSVPTDLNGEALNGLNTTLTCSVTARVLPGTLTDVVQVTVQETFTLQITASRTTISNLLASPGTNPCSTVTHPQLPVVITVRAVNSYSQGVSGLSVQVYMDTNGTYQAFGQLCAPVSGVTNSSGYFTTKFALNDADATRCSQLSVANNYDPADPDICKVFIHARSGTVNETTPLAMVALCTGAGDCR